MSSDSKKSAASRKASAKVLWRSHSAGDLAGAKKKTLVVNDKTWVYRHTHETAGLVTITVKAGNRDYALDSYTEDQKTRISENLLRRRYSEIYPVNDHFFLLSVRDGGKDYVPVSQSVIDIPTAYAFFGLEPKETLSAVNGLVQKLIADYNEQNRNKHFEDRSPSQIYQELAVFQKSVPTKNAWGTSKSRVKSSANSSSQAKGQVTSRLTLVISNWGFVRDQEGNPKFVRCTAHDVSVGFKLESSAFRPTDKSIVKPRYFDRNGASIPYPAFLSLMKDEEFAGKLMDKIRRRYEEDTGRDLRAEAAAASGPQTKQAKAVKSAKLIRKKYAEQFPELAEPEENSEGHLSESDDSDDERLLSDTDNETGDKSDESVALVVDTAVAGLDDQLPEEVGEPQKTGKKRAGRSTREDSAAPGKQPRAK